MGLGLVICIALFVRYEWKKPLNTSGSKSLDELNATAPSNAPFLAPTVMVPLYPIQPSSRTYGRVAVVKA